MPDRRDQPTVVVGGTVGERIRAAIRRAGISQKELADRIGTTPAQISKWVHGARVPDRGSLRRIAEALPVTIDELVGVLEGQDPPFPAWAEFLETDEGRTLTPQERRSLQVMAWPEGREPAVMSYALALTALRSTRRRG